MSNRFSPAPGLGNPHLQTLWGPLWRKKTVLERQRERLWLEDGDFLDLDWFGPHEATHPTSSACNKPWLPKAGPASR